MNAAMKSSLGTTLVRLVGVFCIIGSGALGSLAAGQTVAIKIGRGETGHGWMFQHQDNCFVAFPRHLVQAPNQEFASPRISLTSKAPVLTGTGTVLLPFWEHLDLALASVRGGITDSCTGALAHLQPNRNALSTGAADLLRLTPTGELTRDRLDIGNVGYLTFEGRLADGSDTIAKGTSGAFAFVDDRPIGMAFQSGDDNQAMFMRSEEIFIHLNRYLNDHAGAQASIVDETSSPNQEGFPLALVSVTLPPIDPQFSPENMLADGAYIFDLTQRNQLIFSIRGDAPVPLARIKLGSLPDERYAVPREVFIEFSPFADGRRYFSLGQFRMTPDGSLDTGVLQPRNAQMVRLTILNSWSTGPVGINLISVQ